jgi:hypothetical protein
VVAGKAYLIRVAGLDSAQGIYDLHFDAGDVNRDRRVDVSDIQDLCANVGNSSRHDLDGDAISTDGDIDYLVRSILRTSYGDANLDGVFNSADLIRIFQAGEFEDTINDNSKWSSGDWNCDGEFDTGDLVKAFTAGKYVAAARAPFDTARSIEPGEVEDLVILDRRSRDTVFADVAFRLGEFSGMTHVELETRRNLRTPDPRVDVVTPIRLEPTVA